MAPPQQQQKVQLSLTLSTSPPHSISISDPSPSSPLKLILSIKQIASPFPDRPVTILTKYSCLDKEAFIIRAMESPKLITEGSEASKVTDPDHHAKELYLRPVGYRMTFIRISGDPDLLQRPREDDFTFITIPPLGRGTASIAFPLPPSKLVRSLGNKDESVQEKLLRLLTPGDRYKIVAQDLHIRWWAFGSLEEGDGEEGTSLKGKKFARWSLPDDMPLVRGQGEDETDEVARRLVDLVDLHDVNYLSSRSCVEGEQRPVIREMRDEGWVFGEPESGLEMVVENEEGAVFTITE